MKTLKEMIEVMQACEDGEDIIYHPSYDECAAFRDIEKPSWNWASFIYIPKKTLPSINWDHVHKDFNWLAEDKTRRGSLFTTIPQKLDYSWGSLAPIKKIQATNYAYYIPGTCNWEDSLIERPKE